jgi:predicted RecA/RadA family phage recombinase
MKNFRHRGHTCTLIAAAAVLSGGGFQVGRLFAVANADAKQGEEVEGDLTGVFDLPKSTVAGTDATAGALAYWDDDDKVVTKTADGNLLIGAFLQDCLAADATCVVRLNGVAV